MADILDKIQTFYKLEEVAHRKAGPSDLSGRSGGKGGQRTAQVSRQPLCARAPSHRLWADLSEIKKASPSKGADPARFLTRPVLAAAYAKWRGLPA